MSRASDFNKEASGSARKGQVNCTVLGKVATNIERGFDFFKNLSIGIVQDVLKIGAEAIRAVITTAPTPATKPFALSLKEGFAAADEDTGRKGISPRKLARVAAFKPATP